MGRTYAPRVLRGQCINTQTDASHCGDCYTQCPIGASSTALALALALALARSTTPPVPPEQLGFSFHAADAIASTKRPSVDADERLRGIGTAHVGSAV